MVANLGLFRAARGDDTHSPSCASWENAKRQRTLKLAAARAICQALNLCQKARSRAVRRAEIA